MAEKAPEFVAGFDEALWASLPDRGRREAAFAAYRALPMPTARTEEWRRTDPARFPFAGARLLPALGPLDGAGEGPWDAQFDVVVAVTERGYAVRDVSGALKDGKVSVLPLAEAMARYPDLVTSRRAAPGKFEALNEAFWNFGLFVRVPDGIDLPKGVLVRYACKADRAVFAPRLMVSAGARSQASVVEHLASPDAAALLAVAVKEAHVGEAARLRVVSLQEWGANTCHLAGDWAMVGRDGHVDWITLNLGGRLGKMTLGSDVAGPGANAELDGLYFAAGEQHFDQRTLQVHSAPNTYSRLLYKGAVKDTGRSVYQGLIIARPGASKVDAYQKNNNLVLNDGARADSLPGLEIDTDDLKCSHGSTIGNLDAEQMFYLRSRGLAEAEARRVLINGFFEEVTARVPYEFVRETVRAHIAAKIGGSS